MYTPGIATPALLELGHVPLYPTQNGRRGYGDAALGIISTRSQASMAAIFRCGGAKSNTRTAFGFELANEGSVAYAS
jgi:hypothetical protein